MCYVNVILLTFLCHSSCCPSSISPQSSNLFREQTSTFFVLRIITGDQRPGFTDPCTYLPLENVGFDALQGIQKAWRHSENVPY